MKLRPFLLDEWLNAHQFADPPIEFDLASSTGPHWSLPELLDLADEEARDRFNQLTLCYTDASGTIELRKSIGRMLNVSPGDIQILTGAAEGLLILFYLAAEQGANVVLPFPNFPTFEVIPESLGLETRFYNVRRENGFRIDIEEAMSLVDSGTKLLLMNSPHNPTGAVLPFDEMRALHDFCSEREIQFVVDEVYHPVYHRTPNPSASALPNATVLGDMSKAFSLSGLRVGWIVERNAERMAQYTNARSYFTVSNTPMGEALAKMAVDNHEAIFNRTRRVASANLSLLDEFFAQHNDVLGWIRPEAGVTGFPWLMDGRDSRPFCEKMASQGVLLAPGDCYRAPSHFRIGFGATASKFAEALERIGNHIKRAGTVGAWARE